MRTALRQGPQELIGIVGIHRQRVVQCRSIPRGRLGLPDMNFVVVRVLIVDVAAVVSDQLLRADGL